MVGLMSINGTSNRRCLTSSQATAFLLISSTSVLTKALFTLPPSEPSRNKQRCCTWANWPPSCSFFCQQKQDKAGMLHNTVVPL